MELSDRDRQAMQTRARVYLNRIVLTMCGLGLNRKHFKELRTNAGDEFYEMTVRRLGLTSERAHQLVGTACNILTALATDETHLPRPTTKVAIADLNTLTAAFHRCRIRFDDYNSRFMWSEPRRPSEDHDDEYWHDPEGPGYAVEARLAEYLLEYMNLAVQFGGVHRICQRKDCGALMSGGRGGKKYCSAACRKAAWNYEEKRTYYKQKRSQSRNHKKNRKAVK